MSLDFVSNEEIIQEARRRVNQGGLGLPRRRFRVGNDPATEPAGF